MNLQEINLNPQLMQDWFLPLATLFAIVSTTVGVWLSLKEYRLKVQAETRLTESTRAETDIRLMQHFTDLVYIASGRKGEPVFSKEILDLLIQNNVLTEDDYKNLDELKSKISTAALVAQTPGVASSDAAFASIATLAKRHNVLYEPAIQAMESFGDWNKELGKKYLDSLRKEV